MTKPLPIVGYINPLVADALRDPTSGINVTQLRAERNGPVSAPLVLKADADAVIAQLQAEICRLQASLDSIEDDSQNRRAECAADTRRLDWLADQCVHVYAPSQCAGGIGCGVCLATHKPEIDRNLRKAIDAAMEGGND